MKLKKIISLLLVLALSLMSFTFIVAADDDTVNVAIVPSESTSEMTEGSVFVANVELTDIAAKQLYAAQVTFNFDPEVLQVVSENGEATETVADAVIPGADVYSNGSGYFMYDLTTIDNEEGKVVFSAAKSAALIMNLEAKVDCPSGNYILGGVRFKALKAGLTGIAVNEQTLEIFCANGTVPAQATDKTEAIRIGLPQITDVTNPVAINVDVDTAKEAVIAELPETVSVKYDDDTTGDVAVTWDCADYDAEVAGEYTFIGTIAGTELTASVIVNVLKIAITGATAVESINVPNGASNDAIRLLLPETVEVTLANEATATVAVEWIIPDNAGATAGEVAIEGALDAGTKYSNEGNIKASATLIVRQVIESEIEGTVVPVDNVSIAYKEIATTEGVIAILPATVEIAIEGGYTTAFITWECEEYDAATAGEYIFIGTITLPENVTLAPENQKLEVVVTVEEALEKEVVEVVTVLEDQEVDTSSTLKLVELFDAAVDVKYQDGTTGTETIVWDEESLARKANQAGTYTLNGTVGTNAFAVSVKVTVKGNSGDPGNENYDEVEVFINNRDISGTSRTMFTGQICVLETRETVTWTSSNKSIAFVTADGKLVAQNPGTVTITATTADGTKGSFTLKVALNPSTIASLSGNGSEEVVIPFTDLADYSWATRMISLLANNGVISGKTDTLYAPGDNVTRAEYASLLVRAMKLSANGAGKDFTDVAQGEWYYNAVQTASALGIVSGYEDGSFRPSNSITREEMAIMTLRAAEAAGRSLPAKTSVSFSDADQISGYAKDAVNKLAAAQIINGMGDNNFAPQQTANRAQAAVIIYQLCEL